MKDQKISTMLGTTILIIIAATVVGFVLLCFKKYPVEDNVKSIIVPVQKIDADEWKEYKNEKYRFSFRHPKDWSIVDVDSKISNEDLMDFDLQLTAVGKDEDSKYLSVLLWEDINFSSAEEGFFNRIGRLSIVENKYSKKINDADVFCIEDGTHKKERLGREYRCAFLKDKKLIVFSIDKEFETLGINEPVKRINNLKNSKYFEDIIESVEIKNDYKEIENKIWNQLMIQDSRHNLRNRDLFHITKVNDNETIALGYTRNTGGSGGGGANVFVYRSQSSEKWTIDITQEGFYCSDLPKFSDSQIDFIRVNYTNHCVEWDADGNMSTKKF